MAVLKIKAPPVHKVRVVCVPSEEIKCEAHEVENLEDENGVKYKIHGWFSYLKDEPWPGGMMRLTTGVKLKKDYVYSAYNKSNKLVLFIVEEI